MYSSISNSDDQLSGRRWTAYYVAIILVFALSAFVLAEMSLRVNLIHGETETEQYVARILTSTNPKVLIGDSHGNGAATQLPDFSIINKGSLSPIEMKRVIDIYFRSKKPDRIILVVGANSFSEERQRDKLGLPKNTFKFQFLPFIVHILEPALKVNLSSKVFEALRGKSRKVTAPSKIEEDEAIVRNVKTTDPRRLALERWRQLRKQKGVNFDIGMIGEENQRLLASGRFAKQNPILGYETSTAFTAFTSLLDELQIKGAKVCIVDTPLSRIYQNVIGQEPTSRFQNAQNKIAEEAAKRNIRFADGRILMPVPLDIYFQDQDHLNNTGRAFFWPKAIDYCFS